MAAPYFTLVLNAEVYSPDFLGTRSLLLGGERLLQLTPEGERVRRSLDGLGLPYEVVDAAGKLALPGFVDPHAHLIGAGGEQGFTSRTPEVRLEDLLSAGITTVVGVLGTDDTTRHLTSILARARQLEGDGVTAFMYTGGYPVPVPTMTGSVRRDLVLIDKVIGVGEIAISDARSVEPPVPELAKVVGEALVGGSLSGKAGITHFHVGEGQKRLSCLVTLIEQHDVPPDRLYPTHVNRTPELLRAAVELARRGAFVDMDTVREDLGESVRAFRDGGGPLDRLTVSTDAGTPGGEPRKLRRNVVEAVRRHGLPLEQVLPLASRNPATVLRLARKGRLSAGADADLLIVERETLDLVHVFARGRHLVRDGCLAGAGPQP